MDLSRRRFLTQICLAGGAVAVSPLLSLAPAVEPVLVGNLVRYDCYELVPTEFTPVGEYLPAKLTSEERIAELLREIEMAFKHNLERFLHERIDKDFSRRLEEDLRSLVGSLHYPLLRVDSVEQVERDRYHVQLSVMPPLDAIEVQLEP